MYRASVTHLDLLERVGMSIEAGLGRNVGRRSSTDGLNHPHLFNIDTEMGGMKTL